MTDDQILDERAELYGRTPEAVSQTEVRCLAVVVAGHHWYFLETEIRLLMPQGRLAALPEGVRWGGWPCCGLAHYALTTLPVLSWATLTGQREPARAEQALLIVRSCPVALRVPGPVSMAGASLDEISDDDHLWSRGRLPSGASVADLSRLMAGSASRG